MAFSYVESSATIGTTERSLTLDSTSGVPATDTSAAYVQIILDIANITSADSFELAIYEKTRTADTQRVLNKVFLTAGPFGLYVHPALHLARGWDVTLKKLSGTDRVINWSLRKSS